ncbi:MAG TPA: dTMP kinase [Pyrinomonadaceae bacterium]|nr:dTMP kinase [Pyrinomonadaceae bacterium]
MTGAFITFEGIDGSGKSTQVRMLSSVLRLRGMDVVQTREPGGTPLGARLREALLDAQEQVDPLAELLLYAADRAQHVRALLLPALAAGRVVLSDRFADATVAYQGAGRGFEPSLVDEVVGLATGGLKPDLTLLFDLSVAESGERSRQRTNGDDSGETSDRLELETENFHMRVRDAYLKIAAAEPERVRIVDASLSVEEIHAHVLDIVVPFLENRGQWPKPPETKELHKT